MGFLPLFRVGILTLVKSDWPVLGCQWVTFWDVFACVYVCAPSPALSELQRLPSFIAILFGSSPCIYNGKGLLGRGCRSGEEKAVEEFSFPGIHAIVCALLASLRNGVQAMDRCLTLSWDRLDTGIRWLQMRILAQQTSPGRNRHSLLVKKDVISKK